MDSQYKETITQTKIPKCDSEKYQLPWRKSLSLETCENPLKFWQFDSISMMTPDGKSAWFHKVDL